ncbi:IclR family transcriptional regulator [Bacillus sp. FJAT-44742]|uniref:IclR family transcriptional regulator n=1 Tax=Bacillus sp. FJAT-44742 TaxID=2014005 RepID=UPI000C24254D|nr:IclR family transcriptional regulator [Bacillus sp. FJAT-44742]
MQNQNKTVTKSMALLTLFRQHEELTLQEMVKLSGIPKTSAHRMVGALLEMGFLQKEKDGRYSLGMLFLEFGQLVSERLDIRKAALPVMQKVNRETGEAINLVVKDQLEAIYVEKLEASHPVRLYTKIGRRSPLYAGACPRIILAYTEETEQQAYIEKANLIPFASGTITSKEKLLQSLHRSRIDGYTISFSELENDTVSVAAPIFDYKNSIVGGVSIAGPETRFQKDQFPFYINKAKEAGNTISKNLGWQSFTF